MTRTTTTALAGLALAAAGLAAPAGAQPRLKQTGDGYTVVYDGAAGRGDSAGGGDNAAILYTGPDPARAGRPAFLSGGGDDAVLSYAEPVVAVAQAAGRRG